MLILQRKKNESLKINNNITLSVMEIGADWVKLAIDAPKEIPVLRSELKEAADEKKKASIEVPQSILNEILKKK